MANPKLVSMLFPNEPPIKAELFTKVPLTSATDEEGMLLLFDGVPVGAIIVGKHPNGVDYEITFTNGECTDDNIGDTLLVKKDVIERAKRDNFSYVDASKSLYKERVKGGRLRVALSRTDSIDLDTVKHALTEACAKESFGFKQIVEGKPEFRNDHRHPRLIDQVFMVELIDGREEIENSFMDVFSDFLYRKTNQYFRVVHVRYVD